MALTGRTGRARSTVAALAVRIWVVVLLLVVSSTVMVNIRPTGTVLADCPGAGASEYAYGGRNGITAYGVSGYIHWTQGNVCSSGVSHSVSVCNNGCASGWVQVGWRYYSSYSEPEGYCEFKSADGAFYWIQNYPISHVAHTYRVDRAAAAPGFNWVCKIDGGVGGQFHQSTLGFATGNRVVAQGEAHDPHVQIGMNSPSKLVFSSLGYLSSSGVLFAMNPTLGAVNAPYGRDKPTTSQIRVWTDAH